LLIALAPSAYLAWSSRDLPYLGQYHDDGLYWTAAGSLAEGHGYRIKSLPEEPFQTKYPPLFPLMLSAIIRLCPSNSESLPSATLLAWIMLPACAILAFRSGADLGLGPIQKLLLASTLALNPVAALLSTKLLSELTFCCLLISSLILIEDSLRTNCGLGVFAAGICAGMAYLTRSAGLVLLASGPVYLIVRNKRRWAVWYCVAGLPAVAGWSIWSHAHRSSAPDILYYTDYLGLHLHLMSFRDLPRLLAINSAHLIRSVGGLILFNLHNTVWERFVGAILGFTAILGVVGLGRRSGLKLYHIFAMGYAVMLVSWHFPPTERFLFPVFPLIVAGFLFAMTQTVHSADAIWRTGKLRERLGAAAVCCTLILFLTAVAGNTAAAFAWDFPAYTREQRRFRNSCDRAYAWIRANTSRRANFLAYYDTNLYLGTGRHAQRPFVSVMPFYRGNREESWQDVRAIPVFARAHGFQYYFSTLLDFNSGELLPAERQGVETLLKESGDFEKVYAANGISVYRVR